MVITKHDATDTEYDDKNVSIKVANLICPNNCCGWIFCNRKNS